MKKFIFSTLCLACIILSCRAKDKVTQVEISDENTLEQRTEPQYLTLLFAGDLMQHGVQYKAALQPDGSYSYEECFRFVKDEVSSADVAIANFETTLAGGTPSTYPQFNSPDEYLLAIKEAGFDVLLTANNHSVDKGSKGICRTIEKMDEAGIPHIGTYVNKEERDREYPYIIEKNGFRIALLCYTYGTNGIPVPAPHIVNLIDTVQIRKDIKKAQSMKPDCIIACTHWGTEHALLPNKAQRDVANFLLREGCDHVVGGHPHVVEPVEVSTDKEGHAHVLAFSLGNYISNMSRPNNDGGMMLRMKLTKDAETGKVYLEPGNADYCLTWVSRPVMSKHKNFRIYPANVPETMLNATERAQMKKTLTTERELFSKHNKGIEEYEPIVAGTDAH
ncbi:MAG: CapA family protein [Bacteroidales bacterium]|nr:CapA family protein [Candidatus Physcousia equi]